MTAAISCESCRILRANFLFKLAIVAALSVWIGASTMTAVGPGPLALPEGVPDFSQDATRVTILSAQSGSWSSPATWQGGQIPTSNQLVRILLGHTVTINDTSATAYTVAIDGKLTFAPTVNTRLKVTNLEVMAGNMAMGTPGVLEVGTAATPIAAAVTAEILIANTPLGGSVPDPDQFGTGIIVFGKATMHGSVRTPTFVRLAAEPRAGNTTLTLSEAVGGWKVGDRLVLPDTRHIKESEVTGAGWVNAVNQWEERTVQAVSADGKTLTLNSGLQYDHLGARDLDGVLAFLPHVGNLTRNVIIRSENPAGTRGHTLANHMADVDIRYALFKDLGRTTYQPLSTEGGSASNHIGRYPLHMHHVSGPLPTPANGYQFTMVGNAVDGGSAETTFKWGIAVHGSHYGLIQDNVVYNYNGSSIATEDGSESFNVFDHNFALRGMGEPSNSVSEARMAMGTEGVGFWFRGPNNYVRNNVAANFQNPTTEGAYGFVYQLRFLGNIAVPNFKGADTMGTMGPGQSTTRSGNGIPILQFENNEAYGAMQGGFTLWWVSSQDPQPAANAQESLIKDLKIWNVYNKAVYMYPSQKIIFDGLIIRGSFSSASRCCGNGIYFADYSSKGIVVRNSDIQGVEEGITAPEAGFGPEPNLTIENSYLRNNTNVAVPTNGSVNGCWMNNKLVVVSNTRFDAPPGRSASHLSMVRDVSSAPECLSKLDELRVYAYNGVASDNFQVYHSSTSVVPRPPSGCTPATRAGIDGLTCPIAAQSVAAPTATLSGAPASIIAGGAATLTWSTSNATTVSINQGIGAVAVSGTRSVSPTVTTTYTLTATNAAGSVTATASVSVGAAAPPPPVPNVNVPAVVGQTQAAAITAISAAGLTLGTVSTVSSSTVQAGRVISASPAAGTSVAAGSAVSLVISAGQGNAPGSPAVSRLANLMRNADLDGDGRADLNVYRPSTGIWFNLQSNTNYTAFGMFQWGLPGDIPVSSDYDGDGRTDLAVFRPAGGNWFVRYSSTNFTTAATYQWGLPGDIPVPGDYDGDGKTDLAVYRQPSGMWYILPSSTNFTTPVMYQWGLPGDVLVSGDYDGDGLTDLAVYRPPTGMWYIKLSTTGYATSLTFQWGLSGDISVPGDYDGDGKTDLAVYRISNGVWYIRHSSTGYTTQATYQWGLGGDVPVPSDFDGDGKTDLAVFRPSLGYWFLLRSNTNFTMFAAYQWGLPGDIPILTRQ